MRKCERTKNPELWMHLESWKLWHEPTKCFEQMDASYEQLSGAASCPSVNMSDVYLATLLVLLNQGAP